MLVRALATTPEAPEAEALAAAHPVASSLPGWTGVCRAGRRTPSLCELAAGPGF